MSTPTPVLAIIGPTASGKSDVAMAVARQARAEILSVDSMQVYHGMDVGTAKPTAEQRAQVVHHGLDLVEPTESYTVAKFVEMADGVIADARKRGVPLIAVGGTPMYFKALFEGLFEGPGAEAAIRARLAKESNEELHRRLTQVDPEAVSRIHVRDTKRLVRALEVYELTGKPISSLQSQWQAGAKRHAAVWVGLAWEKEPLNGRINARVKVMLAGGWVEEMRVLLEKYGELSRSAAEATGYQELIEHVKGQLPLDEAAERIKIATRQLARRQMKWFRRFAGVKWLNGDQEPEKLVREILETWRRGAELR